MNWNCYRLSRVSWALLKFLVSHVICLVCRCWTVPCYSRVLLLNLPFIIRCVMIVIEWKPRTIGGRVFSSDRRSVPMLCACSYFCNQSRKTQVFVFLKFWRQQHKQSFNIWLMLLSHVFSFFLTCNLTASPAGNWTRPLGRPRITWMKTIQQDLKSSDLNMDDAVDLAQNRRPLWRLMSIFGAMTHS